MINARLKKLIRELLQRNYKKQWKKEIDSVGNVFQAAWKWQFHCVKCFLTTQDFLACISSLYLHLPHLVNSFVIYQDSIKKWVLSFMHLPPIPHTWEMEVDMKLFHNLKTLCIQRYMHLEGGMVKVIYCKL